MSSSRSRETDPVSQAVATWLKEDAAREPVDSTEQRMEKRSEESKLFTQFLNAELAKGKTIGQAVDEWYARQTEAKAENWRYAHDTSNWRPTNRGGQRWYSAASRIYARLNAALDMAPPGHVHISGLTNKQKMRPAAGPSRRR